MEKQINFRSRARLMPQIGEQLIKNENIAVLELVKNSYDADAKNVQVQMTNVEDPILGKIIVKDDGCGMDLFTVENAWMEIGTDIKKQAFDRMVNSNERSQLNRLPMGEKGIGRFGVHKLGRKIKLVTRKINCKEVFLEIDWDLFNDYEYLEDVPIVVAEREPELFLGDSTGTYIEITSLKSTWTRGKIRDMNRSLVSLNSPFDSIQSFNVEFECDFPNWKEGLVTFDKISEYALFFADIKIKGREILEFNYEFKPWNTLSKLSPREEHRKNIEMCRSIKNGRKNEQIPIDLDKYQIGEVQIKMMIFDLDNTVLSYGISDKKGLKEYLKMNGGISVYRDKMRLYEYGDAGNDWLQLESRRINAPAETISSKITIGAVYIDREKSTDLIEKTNREGFVENEAFEDFRDAILLAIDKVQTQRNIDKELLKKYYGPNGKAEPVVAEISRVRDLVSKKITDNDLKKEINKSLDSIEADYKHITDVYTRSAVAGLSLSVVIHEIDKLIAELEVTVKEEKSSDHIQWLVQELDKKVAGYASVIRVRKQEKTDLPELVEDSLFNVSARIRAHGLEIIKDYDQNHKTYIKCSSNYIMGTIMNIIDNSIYWLEYGHIPNKKVYFKIVKDYEGYNTLIIADNGPGFSLPTEQIIKPFVTDKAGGMGLGLHLADEIMRSCKGKLMFPEADDVLIPDEFKKGAIIGLAFPVIE